MLSPDSLRQKLLANVNMLDTLEQTHHSLSEMEHMQNMALLQHQQSLREEQWEGQRKMAEEMARIAAMEQSNREFLDMKTREIEAGMLEMVEGQVRLSKLEAVQAKKALSLASKRENGAQTEGPLPSRDSTTDCDGIVVTRDVAVHISAAEKVSQATSPVLNVVESLGSLKFEKLYGSSDFETPTSPNNASSIYSKTPVVSHSLSGHLDSVKGEESHSNGYSETQSAVEVDDDHSIEHTASSIHSEAPFVSHSFSGELDAGKAEESHSNRFSETQSADEIDDDQSTEYNGSSIHSKAPFISHSLSGQLDPEKREDSVSNGSSDSQSAVEVDDDHSIECTDDEIVEDEYSGDSFTSEAEENRNHEFLAAHVSSMQPSFDMDPISEVFEGPHQQEFQQEKQLLQIREQDLEKKTNGYLKYLIQQKNMETVMNRDLRFTSDEAIDRESRRVQTVFAMNKAHLESERAALNERFYRKQLELDQCNSVDRSSVLDEMFLTAFSPKKDQISEESYSSFDEEVEDEAVSVRSAKSVMSLKSMISVKSVLADKESLSGGLLAEDNYTRSNSYSDEIFEEEVSGPSEDNLSIQKSIELRIQKISELKVILQTKETELSKLRRAQDIKKTYEKQRSLELRLESDIKNMDAEIECIQRELTRSQIKTDFSKPAMDAVPVPDDWEKEMFEDLENEESFVLVEEEPKLQVKQEEPLDSFASSEDSSEYTDDDDLVNEIERDVGSDSFASSEDENEELVHHETKEEKSVSESLSEASDGEYDEYDDTDTYDWRQYSVNYIHKLFEYLQENGGRRSIEEWRKDRYEDYCNDVLPVTDFYVPMEQFENGPDHLAKINKSIFDAVNCALREILHGSVPNVNKSFSCVSEPYRVAVACLMPVPSLDSLADAVIRKVLRWDNLESVGPDAMLTIEKVEEVSIHEAPMWSIDSEIRFSKVIEKEIQTLEKEWVSNLQAQKCDVMFEISDLIVEELIEETAEFMRDLYSV